MEFIAKAPGDLSGQERCLIPFVDFKLVLYPTSEDFHFEQRSGAVSDAKFVLEELVLMSRQVAVHDAAALTIDEMLRERKSISYPMNSIQCRSFFISAGRTSAPEFKLFSAAMPKRLLLGLVPAANFVGGRTLNPFVFKPFDISEVFLDVGADTIPSRSWRLDFEHGSAARAYLALQDVAGFMTASESNGISFADFKKHGQTIFGFTISPNALSECEDLVRLGETSLRIAFSQPIPAGGELFRYTR